MSTTGIFRPLAAYSLVGNPRNRLTMPAVANSLESCQEPKSRERRPGPQDVISYGGYTAINTNATPALATPNHCRRPSPSRNTSQASNTVEAG